jgi:hypothetical protein
LLQPFIAFEIARFMLRMLPSIELNDESQCGTIEIENVAPDGVLPAKLRIAYLTVSQPMPQLSFPRLFHCAAVCGRMPFFLASG